jgi:pimeloyl-ACP methyl ester carboxylesterase
MRRDEAPLAEPRFADIEWRGRSVRLEYQWVGADVDNFPSQPNSHPLPLAGEGGGEGRRTPLIVFLHEGLGSLAMWKNFPQALCDAAGARGLVYSRPGYGRSTPRASDEVWGVDFMDRQAFEVLPALFTALGVRTQSEPPWFYGHSDGGTIALLYAAAYPKQVAGAIVAAPHIMVEDISVQSIAKARAAYAQTDLKQRLAKYHDDPDSAFGGWSGAWLTPQFRDWSIADRLGSIACPLLAIQGVHDEYGTLEQIRGIARRKPGTALLELADCGHSPHRDQPERTMIACSQWIRQHLPRHTQGETR